MSVTKLSNALLRTGPFRPCRLHQFQCLNYETVWDWQKQLQKARFRKQIPDVLMTVSHPKVYTLGRGGDVNNILFDMNDPNYKLYKIERGGQVTHHYPGQLVAYPILNLNYYGKDLHLYLRMMEEVIIRTLFHFDIEAGREEGMTGVWVNGKKIAAMGMYVSRWITMHGISLNVYNDLDGFKKIIPCGLKGKEVCCMEEYVPNISMDIVRKRFLGEFEDVFQTQFYLGSRTSPLDCDQPQAPSYVQTYYNTFKMN
ncbi:hypothetical protein WA158_006196 [Blastocystis sp. Blastoise]